MASTVLSVARLASLLSVILPCVSGHAYVYWPASRNWKAAPHIAHCFNVPGPPVSFQTVHNGGNPAGKAGKSDFAKGMCGNFGVYTPQANLADDGIANWDKAETVETYASGGPITFTIVNNAEHGGHYEFRLCDKKLDASIGSREDAARCFDAHFLGRECVPQCGCDSDRCKSNAEHNDKSDPIYSHGEPRHLQQGGHQVTISLPAGLTCEWCTTQWFWHTAWGEQFWNCIDIRIEGGGVNPTLRPTLPPSVAPTPTTPGGGGGGADLPCMWTSPAGKQVTTRKQNEKPGRICWEFEVPMGTMVHYQKKVDIYHSWNTDTCCLFSGSSGSGGPANVVTFTPQWGSFGFCECIGWNPSTGGTTCAGQATPAAMICPVPGGDGSMCVDTTALQARPSECGSGTPAPPVAPTPGVTPSPPTCAADWGSCLSSRCCASSHFTCYEQDASYAECRSDGCPAGWKCNELKPVLPAVCADFCGRVPSSESCSSFVTAATCNKHYFQEGTHTMPCSWTGCGECFANGAGLLDCPDLTSVCASGCQQLCGKEDLALTSKTCNDYSHDQGQCERSYFSRAGRSMPCKWTACRCYADGETLLQCPDSTSNCGTSLLMKF